jgi:hypothetical protein
MSGTLAHWKRNVKSALIHSQAVQQLLSIPHIEHRCRQAGQQWRRSFWSPPVTVLTFLMQVLNPVKTLRAAVADTLSQWYGEEADEDLPSADPSAYSQARQKVPEAALRTLLDDATRQVRAVAGDDRLWCGRVVKIIDGSSVSMPDTPDLQQAFPQPAGQTKGCGFPVAYLTAMFDWGTGAVLDWRMGSHHDSEISMFRSMLDHFGPGTVALADRYYCSYVDVARLMERGAEVVFRLHERRSHDFRQGQPLGPNDRLVTWHRPRRWLESFGISRAQFEALPQQITLRMVRTTPGTAPKGFRSKEIVIITTLLDPVEVSVDQLLALYRDRWMIELNLRHLKTTLKMETLRGKSVAMVRKEFIMHLLLYNLLRLLMWEAARLQGVDPRRLSFAGTLHRLHALAGRLLWPTPSTDMSHDAWHWLVRCMAQDVLPNRPNRFEPRRVKRRPKQYSRLTQPRTHYHRHGDDSCR